MHNHKNMYKSLDAIWNIYTNILVYFHFQLLIVDYQSTTVVFAVIFGVNTSGNIYFLFEFIVTVRLTHARLWSTTIIRLEPQWRKWCHWSFYQGFNMFGSCLFSCRLRTSICHWFIFARDRIPTCFVCSSLSQFMYFIFSFIVFLMCFVFSSNVGTRKKIKTREFCKYSLLLCSDTNKHSGLLPSQFH